MNKIEVKILNPESIKESVKMTACSARLTQRGHKIQNMDDFMELYNKPYTEYTIAALTSLPHPAIQKMGNITVVIVGASRRFLAQITRHQNETKFISASLQYSDYSDSAQFCVPYEILEKGDTAITDYLKACGKSMEEYKKACAEVGNDAAGYLAPQGLRNILIISATPYQWKYMIGLRTCRRNTTETRYVLLKIWKELFDVDPIFFAPVTTGCFCQKESCKEGAMSCRRPLTNQDTPDIILQKDFSIIYKEEKNEN